MTEESQFNIKFNPDFKAWNIKSECWEYACFEAQAAFYDEGTYRLHPFTGILDRNGKKIYHGDILLADEDTMKLMDSERKYVLVGFCNGAFMYGRQSDAFHLNTYLFLFANYHEVVGNFYEHRDLLEPGFPK